VAVIERSVTAAPITAGGAGVGYLAGSNAPGLRGRAGWKVSFSTRHERCLRGVILSGHLRPNSPPTTPPIRPPGPPPPLR
jgi:hypothetical protein